MLELIEKRRYCWVIGMISQAADSWDGSQPLRTMADLMAG